MRALEFRCFGKPLTQQRGRFDLEELLRGVSLPM